MKDPEMDMDNTAPHLELKPCFGDEIAEILGDRVKQKLPVDGMVTAAVLVPLFAHDGRCHVLLTKRSEEVEHHKGEISFPGGKFDESDRDFMSCALRETAEEVGISPSHVRMLGELDDFYTVATGYLVVPFVGIIPYPYNFKPSSREIADLLEVPLEVFFDSSNRNEYILNYEGQEIEVVSYLWQGHNIWGATARILKHFTEVIDTAVSAGLTGGCNQGRKN
jgi:8-oxo-dGTP pyrophosphatase MutT (NUDIX family)